MSENGWKPGDVVTATVEGRENVRLVAGWSRYKPQLRWCEMSPRWGDGDDDECWFMPSQVTDHRPLVVIDPEDREQVERLTTEYVRTWLGPRETTSPESVEEPQGLGAVVEDAEGRRWVRSADDECVNPWNRENGYDSREYRDITAVRILSEGVPS
jgi:hypothetical protein